jgi:hypothetical protein
MILLKNLVLPDLAFPLYVLALLYFVLAHFGLGFLALRRTKLAPGARKTALAGLLGIALSQSLIYLNVPCEMVAVATLSGGLYFVFPARKGRNLKGIRETWPLWLIGFIPVGMVLFEKLVSYDARAIWYAHGKMLYEQHSLWNIDWQDPSIAYTHPDYPKLIGALGALFSQLLGFWDDRWPKATLLLLFSVGLIAVQGLGLSAKAGKAYFLTLVLALNYLLWNGQADGYLALFSCLSVFYLGIFWREQSPLSICLAMGFLGLVLQLKNEGTLLTACILAASYLELRRQKYSFSRIWSKVDWLWLLWLPAALWSVGKSIIGLGNDMASGFQWDVMGDRLASISFWKFFAYYYFIRAGILLPILLLVAYRLRLPKRFSQFSQSFHFRVSLWSCILYSGLLVLVYASTYLDLHSHLHSSFNRVGLPLSVLMLSTFFFPHLEVSGTSSNSSGALPQ